MSLAATTGKREHALLIGDGFLITVGTATLAVALAFALSNIRTSSDGAQASLEIGSGLLMLAAGVLGVVLAWRLHGRRIDGATVVGGLLGGFIGGSAIWIVAIVSWLLGLPLRLFTDWEFAGPVATLVLMSIGVAALFAWLVTDAVRDASAEQRHLKLDWARFASVAAFAALVAVSVYLVFAQPGPEQGEAPIWAMAGGLIGAGVVAGADIANALMARRRSNDVAAGPEQR